jgi:hypothetical protein
MSVLNQTVNQASQAADQVRAITKQMYTTLGRGGLQGYNLIWNNPNATPMEVVAALGTDAAAIFQFAVLNINTIQAAATIGGVTATAIPGIPSAYTIAFNQDGSATVTPVASSGSSGFSGLSGAREIK